MSSFTIDARRVRSFPEFVEAVNAGLIRPVGGEWHGNLDAFNDYLSWPDDEQYELVIVRADHCARALGHRAKARRLTSLLSTAHPSNLPDICRRIADAQAGVGTTLFDDLMSIIRRSPSVRLVLR